MSLHTLVWLAVGITAVLTALHIFEPSDPIRLLSALVAAGAAAEVVGS